MYLVGNHLCASQQTSATKVRICW